MTLLDVERIKLFSTRSPWWCAALAITIVVGLSALIAANTDAAALTISTTGLFTDFGMVVVMVMATLSVTTEYRFGTIRTTFQAVPSRSSALIAKAVVVGLLAAVVGLIAGFGAWGLARIISPDAPLELVTAADWRAVAGTGLVYGLAGVIAVAVGILVRQTAAAVSILLVWTLLAENLITLIPNVGAEIQRWLPFVHAANFRTGGLPAAVPPGGGPEGGPGGGPPAAATDLPFDPVGSGFYFAAIAVGLLVIALIVAERRDA